MLLSLGGLCLDAPAADWQVSGTDAAGRQWSIDADSLNEEGGYLHVWVRIDYGGPQQLPGSGDTYVDEIDNLAIDCAKHHYAVAIAHRRDAFGRVVATNLARPDEWEFVDAAPESIGLQVLEDACAYHERAVAEEARRLREYLESEDWKVVAVSEDRTVSAYVNTATASREGEIATALIQYRYETPALMGDKRVKYLLVLEVIDCSRSVRYLGGSLGVDENGRTLGKYHAESPDDAIGQPVLPDSLGAGVLGLLCRNGSARGDGNRDGRSGAELHADAAHRSSSM